MIELFFCIPSYASKSLNTFGSRMNYEYLMESVGGLGEK